MDTALAGQIAWYALLFASIPAGIFLIVDGIDNVKRDDDSFFASFMVSVCVFLGLFAFSFVAMWRATPALHFGNVYYYVMVCALITAGIGYVRPWLIGSGTHSRWSNTKEQVPAGSIVALAFVVFWVPFGVYHTYNKTDHEGMAKWKAGLANVEMAQPDTYPETSTEHMVLVPEQAAREKADEALSQGDATVYSIREGALQSVNGEFVHVFDLSYGWWDRNPADHHVPAYITVGAESMEVRAEYHDGFDIRYFPGGPGSKSLSRLIWEKYADYVIDDITFELDDDYRPFYTATINKPATTFEHSVPVRAIIIDPQTGDITPYELDELPEWVDRVYSAETAQQLMNWWGRWSGAPYKQNLPLWKRERDSGRYEVSGKPHLVYVNDAGEVVEEPEAEGAEEEANEASEEELTLEPPGHGVWQMLITSWKSDTSAKYVAMFDARTGEVKLYAYDNLRTEEKVLEYFEDTSDNKVNKHRPVHPSLHRINGTFTWVASYVSKKDAEDDPAPLQMLGMMPALNSGARQVAYGSTLDDVLTEYQSILVNNVDPDAPAEEVLEEEAEGTVTRVAIATRGDKTYVEFMLEGDASHFYSGEINPDRAELTELGFLQNGDVVTIRYIDGGGSKRGVTSIDVESLLLRN